MTHKKASFTLHLGEKKAKLCDLRQVLLTDAYWHTCSLPTPCHCEIPFIHTVGYKLLNCNNCVVILWMTYFGENALHLTAAVCSFVLILSLGWSHFHLSVWNASQNTPFPPFESCCQTFIHFFFSFLFFTLGNPGSSCNSKLVLASLRGKVLKRSWSFTTSLASLTIPLLLHLVETASRRAVYFSERHAGCCWIHYITWYGVYPWKLYWIPQTPLAGTEPDMSVHSAAVSLTALPWHFVVV